MDPCFSRVNCIMNFCQETYLIRKLGHQHTPIDPAGTGHSSWRLSRLYAAPYEPVCPPASLQSWTPFPVPPLADSSQMACPSTPALCGSPRRLASLASLGQLHSVTSKSCFLDGFASAYHVAGGHHSTRGGSRWWVGKA